MFIQTGMTRVPLINNYDNANRNLDAQYFQPDLALTVYRAPNVDRKPSFLDGPLEREKGARSPLSHPSFSLLALSASDVNRSLRLWSF